MAIGDLTTLANVEAWLGIQSDNGPNDALIKQLITRLSRTIVNHLQRPSLISQVYTDLSDGTEGFAEYLDNWPVTSVSQVAVSGRIIPPSPLTIGSNISTNYGYRLQPWDGYTPGGPQAVELIGGRFERGRLNVSITYTAGYLVPAEAWMIPATPYQITVKQNLGTWSADSGVTYANGTALAPVSGSPAVGQYSVAAGVYTFAAADAGQSVLISYSYTPSDLEDACINWIAERFKYKERIGQRSKTLGGQETVSFDVSAIPAFVMEQLQPYKKVLPV